MAVKVRCPTCEKVLNAPDTARGKAIKCPGCETKVKVPVGDTPAGPGTARKTGAKAPAKKKVDEPDSAEFLANLDLGDHADSSEAMCPRCGAAIPEDATECPKCGVDPTTGQLSASAKKRRNMKGPDPALFYGEAWRDSWAFVKQNKQVGFRTFFYSLLFSISYAICVGLARQPSFTLPPRVFWGVLAGACFLVMPGWQWFLTIETIRTTVSKKKLNLGKVNFDIFLCMALGIKTILWFIVFLVFLPIPFAHIMYPLAMVHMAMPVTKRGWFNFLMLPTFFRNAAPTLYFWVIAIATNIPGIIVYALPYILFWNDLLELSQVKDVEKLKMTTQMWVALSVFLFAMLVVQFVSSFALLFNVRVIGLIAYYFQNTLDLTTFVEDKVYVAKQAKLDRFGVPIRTTGQKVGQLAIVIIVLAVVGAAGYFVYRTVTK